MENMKKAIGIFIFFSVVSCTYTPLKTNELNDLKNNFKNTEVHFGRGMNLVALYLDTCKFVYYYSDEYIFEKESCSCKVESKLRDSLFLKSKSIIEIIKNKRIKGYTEEFKNLGISLLIYGEKQSQYFQMDSSLLKGNWIKFVAESKYLGDHWYLHEDR